ncbi:MAG: TolC family protein [Planctomycetes bacterium]|nr:TolC family protein [Planctomycetota bacterium]
MTLPRPLLAALVALCGCMTARDDTTWVLPADPEAIPTRGGSQEPPQQALVLNSGGPAAVTSLWTPGSGPLQLGHVLAAVDASFPLLSVARQEQILKQAKQIKALGSFDLKLSAQAQWNLEGFYENHTAGVMLEQATGLWGTRVLGGYRVGDGDFDLTFDGKRRINNGGEFSAGVAVPLLRGGEIDPARRDLLTAGHERDMADSKLESLRLKFSAEAAEAYWDWVAAGQEQQVARALLNLAVVRQRGIEEAFANGALAEIEVLDNRRLVVEREGLVISARRKAEKAALALALFLRDASGQPLQAPESAQLATLPPGEALLSSALEADLELALQRRPDLRNLTQQQARERVTLGAANNELLPQLDLTVLASQDLDRRRPSVTKGEFELVAGLKFEFPLQNRKARGLVLESEARLGQLGEQLRLARDQVALEVRDAFSALQAAYAREQQARQAAELAQRVADAERQRFGLGDSTVLNLNLREAAAARAQLGVVSASRDYWTAAAKYSAAVGLLPLSPGLGAP